MHAYNRKQSLGMNPAAGRLEKPGLAPGRVVAELEGRAGAQNVADAEAHAVHDHRPGALHRLNLDRPESTIPPPPSC